MAEDIIVDVLIDNESPTVDVEVANRAGGTGGITKVLHDSTLVGDGVKTLLGVNTNVVATKEEIPTRTSQLENDSGYISDISHIVSLIPPTANIENPLADQGFVNSSIQTSTAHFRGNWDTWADVPSDPMLYPMDAHGNHAPTPNDYLVIVADEQQEGGTWRYKYTGDWSEQGKDGWQAEYQINETPLTAAQLAALNSGITEEAVNSFVKNTDYASSSKGGVVKTSESFGIIINEDGTLYAARANLDGYNAKSKHYVIGKDTLENIKNDLVKRAVTENNIVLTDEEKTAAQEWLGGLPLSGGTLTGALTIDGGSLGVEYGNKVLLTFKTARLSGQIDTTTISAGTTGLHFSNTPFSGVGSISPAGTAYSLGDSYNKWWRVYTTILNNGANIAVPTIGGTMALESNVVALTESTVELATNTIYNAGEMATLTITFPTADETYVSQLNFTSGSTATAFTAPDTVKWIGDDISDGAFVPATGKRYVVLFYFDGLSIRGAIQST